MSKLSDIASTQASMAAHQASLSSTQASLMNTQASLAAYQINISEQMSEITSHQSDLSHSQQEFGERILDIEEVVIERGRVDPTTPNPDLFQQGEVVTHTSTGLPLKHLSSR